MIVLNKKSMNLSRFIVCAGLLSSLSVSAQKKEKGWQPLFNGKDFTGWKKLAGTADYKIEKGVIVGTSVAGSPNTFLVTEKEYGDFILELEIKVEDSTSNSGVQTRSHFNPDGNGGKGQVYGRQVELDPTSRAWTGGIYDEARRQWLYPLDLNPTAKSAFKIGEFNHFRIECIGNETKTFVNGVSVAYVVDTIDSKGFIGLQVHSVGKPEHAGRKTYFKNVKINTTDLQPKPFAAGAYVVNNTANSLAPYEKQDGWKLLFDGKTSNGWLSARGKSFPAKGWEIADGTISVLSSAGKESANGGDIVSEEQFSAFDLSFSFKLSPGANSGVKYFVTLAEKSEASSIGLEFQVLDDEKHPDAKMGRDGNRTLSSLYDLITANKNPRFIHKIGEWNTGRVVVYPDNRVEHYLNGSKVVEYVRGSQAFRDLVAISKYKIWPNFGEAKQGRILLQDHGDAVSFSNIKIKELK
jgi:hypothetical protein